VPARSKESGSNAKDPDAEHQRAKGHQPGLEPAGVILSCPENVSQNQQAKQDLESGPYDAERAEPEWHKELWHMADGSADLIVIQEPTPMCPDLPLTGLSQK